MDLEMLSEVRKQIVKRRYYEKDSVSSNSSHGRIHRKDGACLERDRRRRTSVL